MNLEANRNEDWMKLKLSTVKQLHNKIKLGGGKKAIDKQHEKNKLTPRERIEFLLDKDKPFIEIGALLVLKCMKNKVAAQLVEQLLALVM
jgi:acetyl-CoA carboxylase carboxyltransferase component